MAERVYNLIDGGRKYGPFSKEELAAMLESGEIVFATLCIRAGDGEIREVAELFDKRKEPKEEEVEDEDEDEDYEDDFEEVAWEDGIWYADEDEDDDYTDEPAGEAARKAALSELDSDEVICRLHPHIFGYPKLLGTVILLVVGSLALLVLGPMIGLSDDSLSMGGFGLAGLTFGLLLILRSFDNYYITRSRAEIVQGMIAKSSKEVRLSDIRRIDVDKRGLLGLLNVGDVKLSSAGTGGFDVIFAYVKAGHKLKKVLRRVQKEPTASKRYLLHGKSWLRRSKS
ncbi:DUF4339 domain-containing protein [Verrucomicrobiales bacterium]|jgi:hypothetical protein|nr:DUF4339 domain-containing protein [Verrucomicrobiales bacterium]